MISGILRRVAVSAVATISMVSLAVAAIPSIPVSAEGTTATALCTVTATSPVTVQLSSSLVDIDITPAGAVDLFQTELYTSVEVPTDYESLVLNGLEKTLDLDSNLTTTIQAADDIAALTSGGRSTGDLGVYVVLMYTSGADPIIGCSTTVTVEPPAPTYFVDSLPGGTVDSTYSESVAGVDVTGEYAFSLADGDSLPPGLLLDELGNITGTPTAAGTYTFSITFVDGYGTETKQYTITIDAATLCSITTSASTVTVGGTVTATATLDPTLDTNVSIYAILTTATTPAELVGGGRQIATRDNDTGGTTFSVEFTPSEKILDLSSNARNTGVLYLYVFGDVGDTSKIGCTTSITVEAPTRTAFFAADLDNGTVGSSYSDSAAGADASAVNGSFTLATGSQLPSGLTLNTDGSITGTPGLPGTYTFTISYTEGEYTEDKEYTITVGGVCSVTATPGTIKVGASTVIEFTLNPGVENFLFAYPVTTLTTASDFSSLTGQSYDFDDTGKVSVVGSTDISALTWGVSNTGTLLVYAVVHINGNLVIGCSTSVTVENVADVPTLTVTPDPETLQYGDPEPEYTYTVTDKDGNEVLDLDGDPTCDSDYTNTTPVAESPLAITCTGAAKTGYEIVYAPASVTIIRKNVLVKPTDVTVTFGDQPPLVYGFTYVDEDGNTLELSFEEEPECSSSYTDSTWVTESPVFIDCVYPGEEGPIFQLQTDNYLVNAIFLRGRLSIEKRTVYVVPDDQSIAYGTTVPGASFYTFEYFLDAEHTITAPDDGSLVTAPECGSTYTAATPVIDSPLNITCIDGTSSNYAYNLDASAELTITRATATAAAYTGTLSLASGGTLNLASSVTPSTCTATPSYSLDADPTGGTTVPYPLQGTTVSTAGWLDGVYLVTVNYPEDDNCTAVSDSSSSLVIGSLSRGAAFGGGWYNAAGGKASFGFQVQTYPKTSGSPSSVKGQLSWVQKGSWRFKGTLTTYSMSNGVGTASGTGTLQYWKTSGGSGGVWIDATTGPAAVTVSFTATTPATKKSGGSVGSFAIGFTGTRTGGAPSLPALGARSNLTGGSIKAN